MKAASSIYPVGSPSFFSINPPSMLGVSAVIPNAFNPKVFSTPICPDLCLTRSGLLGAI